MDKLAPLGNEWDRRRARKHRLSGQEVLPPRPDGPQTRLICRKCWTVLASADWPRACPTCQTIMDEVTT